MYELAIMQRRQLALEWWDAQGERQKARLTPVDLKVREGAEYLLLCGNDDNTEQLEIRLDRIIDSEIVGP
jgi:hypothetical protein